MLGNLLYLKLTQLTYPLLKVILLPRHNGFVTSTPTLMRMKLLPSYNSSLSVLSITVPTSNTILFAILVGIPISKLCNWTYILVVSNRSLLVSKCFCTLFNATRCLSKDHGSPFMICSTSPSSQNINKTIWLPMSLTSKSFLAHHSHFRVFAITSMFNTRPM